MRDRRGSALVLVLGILTLLMIMGSAFLLLVVQEARTSRAAGRGLAADCAARAGLAHAAYRVALAGESYVSFNGALVDEGGWTWKTERAYNPHRFFEKLEVGDKATLIYDRTVWGKSWDGEEDRGGAHTCNVDARRIDLPAGWPAPPAYLDPKSRPVMTKADYAVAVFALDGRLHTALASYMAEADADAVLADLAFNDVGGDLALLKTADVRSIGELQAQLADADNRVKAEQYLTPYPFAAAQPEIDINTAGRDVLLALANRVVGLADPDKAVTAIETWRPFKAWGDSVDPNPALGDLEDDTVQKALRREYSGDPAPADYVTASDKTKWPVLFKFRSRFWHVYVVGRSLDAARTRVWATRRLHAIYDAEARRFLWMRWNQDFTKSNWNAP